MNNRADFEKAAMKAGHDPVWDGDQYLYEDVQTAWEIWQAASSESAEAVAYRCHYCEAITPRPKPFSAIVICERCGHTTAATVAADLGSRPPTTPGNGEWVRCEDVEPPHNECIDAWAQIAGVYQQGDSERVVDVFYDRGTGQWWHWDEGCIEKQVIHGFIFTHWKHRPQPPVQGGE